MKNILFFVVLLMIYISGCSQIQPISTVTPIPAITKEPTSTPSATLTPTLLPTATFTLTPTRLPTLQADKAIRKAKELLETNNGCALPCFWGITPGITSWDYTNSFLQTFSNIESHSSNGGEFYFDINGPSAIGLHITLSADNELVSFIQVSDFDSSSYHLSEFLVQNGKPDQVMLRTWKNSPSNTDQVPFLIYMYYKTSGMLVAYGYGTGTIKSDYINGCVDLSPSVEIWGIEKPQNIEDAMKVMGWYDSNLLSISDATAGALDVDNFYKKFSQSNVDTCFRTSRNLWLAPDR